MISILCINRFQITNFMFKSNTSNQPFNIESTFSSNNPTTPHQQAEITKAIRIIVLVEIHQGLLLQPLE